MTSKRFRMRTKRGCKVTLDVRETKDIIFATVRFHRTPTLADYDAFGDWGTAKLELYDGNGRQLVLRETSSGRVVHGLDPMTPGRGALFVIMPRGDS
nr:hypothetical protein [Gammaproteobacteria bacterium]